MKSLQTLVITSLLIGSVSMAHASATNTLSASTLSAETYQDPSQDSTSHPADPASGEQPSDTSATRNDIGASSHLPVSNGNTSDSAPVESVRTPSWQSLLPGSIQ